MIYLDNSATTCVRPEVTEAMLPFLSAEWGNPSSLHRPGRTAQEAIKKARRQVAGLLNCHEEEIYFSPCGTYSNNTAIIGRARFIEANGMGRHIITCRIEHPSVAGPIAYLEAQGWRVTYLPVDESGLVSPASLKQAIGPDTTIISIMWANNEIGTVQPIEELSFIACDRGIYFHTDAVQVPGKLAIDTAAVRVSSLSLSGHKFYAPKGIGVLYLRKDVNLMPVTFGGGQERGLFPGTEPLANIVGIGKAAELCAQELENNFNHLRRLQSILAEKLLSVNGVRMTGPRDLAQRLPGHVSVVVADGDGEALVLQSDLKGICISSGSACHKGIKSPSSVLTAINTDSQMALGSARISAGRLNTEEECRKAADILANLFASGKANACSAT